MAPAGPGGQLTQEIIRVTCSHFGSHSASSHRPEQQQPSSQPEVSGRNGPRGEPQRGDGPGPDPGALHPLHEGVSQRRPAPTRVQEDLRRSQQLRRGVALHRDHLPLLRHQPGERQGSGLWALASGLWALGSGLQALFYQSILFSACRTTRWTSWSTWRRCTSSCGGTWRTDSSGPSRCTTRTGTGSWTATRSSGSSRSDLRSDPQNRIHTSNPGFHNVSRCTVSTAAISEHLYLPNGLSATRCYVILVGLRFYFRCWTDPLFS